MKGPEFCIRPAEAPTPGTKFTLKILAIIIIAPFDSGRIGRWRCGLFGHMTVDTVDIVDIKTRGRLDQGRRSTAAVAVNNLLVNTNRNAGPDIRDLGVVFPVVQRGTLNLVFHDFL